ncbi:hypothetical protein GA0070616_0140 [Micromonospora nigra]|uniref:Uncharacterized protein n=1 Tax=Micromonospora nigra TaxID=145857 RepID=A0A1C6R7V6_9ACTN|nr:hypothetical protein [Micromonospora nigra]SCL13143.1 hypothetical protein GA0070616_0140 [Micromonospora nigra]
MANQHGIDEQPITALPLLAAQLEAGKFAVQAHLSLLPQADLSPEDLTTLERQWEESLPELYEMFELPGQNWLSQPGLPSSTRGEVERYLELVQEVNRLTREAISKLKELQRKTGNKPDL